jgi:hypothetical protein
MSRSRRADVVAAEKWSPAPARTMTLTASSATARVKRASSAGVMLAFCALR